MKLLHIDSSILGDNSASRQLSAGVVKAWQAAQPGVEVTYRGLLQRHQPFLRRYPGCIGHCRRTARCGAKHGLN